MAIESLTEARIEFKHHIAFIHLHNPPAAIRIEAEVIRRVGMLKTFPSSGRPGRMSGTRELLVSGTPYILIYVFSDRVIQTAHVVHTSQQWPPEDE